MAAWMVQLAAELQLWQQTTAEGRDLAAELLLQHLLLALLVVSLVLHIAQLVAARLEPSFSVYQAWSFNISGALIRKCYLQQFS